MLTWQWVQGEWVGWGELRARVDALETALPALETDAKAAADSLAKLRAEVDAEVAATIAQRSATIAQLDRAAASATARLMQARTDLTLKAATAGQARLVANRAWNRLPWWARTEAAVAWSEETRAWAAKEAVAVGAETAQRAAGAWLAEVEREQVAVERQLGDLRRQLAGDAARIAKAHEAELARAQQALDGANRALDAARTTLAADHRRLASSWLQRAWLRVRSVLPGALLLLVGYFGLPVLWKALTYFVFSRLVSDRTPIQLAPPGSRPSGVRVLAASGVSVELDLAPREQLVVKPAYLQSSDVGAPRDTRLVLSKPYWFASIASGMWLLTRVRPAQGEATRVRVTATDDVLGELTVLVVPEGEGLVLRPSALAGVVHPGDREVPIRSRWRWRSLHAWASWQLRFLEFQGPCRLIVKGTRGVRVETIDGGAARQINGSATLGFAPSVPFRVHRTETFLPYLRNQEPLFNDLFGPGRGVIVYEERPSGRDGARVVRALTRWLDAFRQGLGI
jgi:uncharacterized protein (AIM24 family)